MTAPVKVRLIWIMWVNVFIKTRYYRFKIQITIQSCAYLMGYVVHGIRYKHQYRARNSRSAGSQCDEKWRRATADPKYRSPAGDHFFATWYVKIACFHNIKRCWKWPASRRLDANWFSLCVAWMNGFRAQGTGLRYYGMCKYRACDWPAWDARLLSVLDIKLKVTINKPFFKAAWTNYTNVPPECLG